jgi:uncharacterized protein
LELTGTKTIPAPREAVWRLLNDVAVLKAALKGCEELAWDGENLLRAVVRAKIGPMNARFKGKITLLDLTPPASYALVGEGQGGVAGFAKGRADVTLREGAGGTELAYTAKAIVGGKMAQLGQRLLDAAARKMAEDFFAAFAEEAKKRHAAAGTLPQE